ncbi:MAG: hypothetical protein JWN37_477 [Candidatus Nomurabacteria bacterium]|nr:hypothetical protein [Candidatus Nomurabacteria bacterium]
MTYLSDKKRKKRGYIWYSVVILLIFIFVYFWPSVRTFLYNYVEGPVIIYGSTRTGIVSIPYNVSTYFKSKKDLEDINRGLELNIERLENEIAVKDAIISDNKLSQNGSSVSTLEMYSILEDSTNIYSTIILSKGFKDGLEINKLVYLRGRQPVCIIVEVHDQTSVCKLLSSSGSFIEGVSPNGETLFLKGDGGGTFIADIPRDAILNEGDSVHLKSDPTLLLGTVVSIVKDNQATAWKVYVRGQYNPITSNVFYTDK